MTPEFRHFPTVLMAAFLGAAPSALAEPGAGLRVEALPDGIAFHLVDAVGPGPWLLRHAPDGRAWDDLLFLEGTEAGREQPGVDLQWGVLPDPDARRGLFRVVQLEEEDSFLRRFLSERAKWRLSGINDYQYELRQNFGQISWRGIVVVVDGEVASFQTIDLQPPVVDVPHVPTIGELFDRIASAMAQDAAIIDVSWNPIHGFPVSCYIDLDPLLADEERGWTILAFTPAP